MEDFRAFFAFYLRIESHSVGDFTADLYKKYIAGELVELADFVAVQSPQHPILWVIEWLWDYLLDDTVGDLFDHFLNTIPVGEDKNLYLAHLSETILHHLLTTSTSEIYGDRGYGCDG